MSLFATILPSVREKKPCRFRPSKALYQFTYSTLAYLYGEKCSLCRRGPPDVKLEIDHVDGRRDTWRLGQLSLRCQSCNRGKFIEALTSDSVTEREKKGKSVLVASPSVLATREEIRNISWESSRSLELEPAFRLELQRVLAERGSGDAWQPTVSNVESRLAKILGCTQLTVTRWIDRELQPEGCLDLSERVVQDGRKKRTQQIIGFKRV